MSVSSQKKKTWAALSRLWCALHPVCQICHEKPSNQTHHIIPRARGNSVYFHGHNLLAVCAGCHMEWHNRMDPDTQVKIAHREQTDFQKVLDVQYQHKKFTVDELKQMERYFKNELEAMND